MIPDFPKFKKLDLADKSEVESITNAHPPYSDFNFVSMWSWDTSEERMISSLNGNLVVRFTDYSTHEPFLSFLGETESEKTIRTLLEYSVANGLPKELRLVPEISVKNIRQSVVLAKVDNDNNDYVYMVSEHARFTGSNYLKKRAHANRFKRNNPGAHIEVIDLRDKGAQRDIFNIMSVWEKNKLSEKKEYELEHELEAINRIFKTALSHSLLVTAVFTMNGMLAFSIDELLPNQYAINHFWKADTTKKGIFDFLAHEKAKHLETLNIAYLNVEQDLGIESLRRSKMTFCPTLFLNKYVVENTE